MQPLRRHPHARRLAHRTRIATLAAVAAVVALAGCTARSGPPPPRAAVTVAPAVQRDMPFALVATGTVEPIETAAVGSQVGGVVTRVAFREGADVARGQVLFELDARPFQAALGQALGALARDRAQAANARLAAERAAKLLPGGLIAQSDADLAEATALSAAAAVAADSAAVVAARLNLQYAAIRAPIAGRTGQLLVRTGDLVKAATADPLVTINQMRPVRIRFTVPQSAVPLVTSHSAGHLRVLARTGDSDSTEIEGRLVFVDNGVDPASGTLLLKGEFANRDGRLVPGEFVDVRLVLDVEAGVIVVPAPAVTVGQQGAYVYVLNADTTVTPRPITVERTVDDLAIIGQGLRAGETVVTDGQLRLAPGARVLVRQGVAE